MIFLYRFDVKENGIQFVLNKQIAADMLPHHDILLRPLVTVLAETLQLYCLLRKEPTLLTSNMRENGEIEVILNQRRIRTMYRRVYNKSHNFEKWQTNCGYFNRNSECLYHIPLNFQEQYNQLFDKGEMNHKYSE
jgi:hypothetical protein